MEKSTFEDHKKDVSFSFHSPSSEI